MVLVGAQHRSTKSRDDCPIRQRVGASARPSVSAGPLDPLDEIAEAAAGLASPALFVIGDVVGLAAALTSVREMIALAS